MLNRSGVRRRALGRIVVVLSLLLWGGPALAEDFPEAEMTVERLVDRLAELLEQQRSGEQVGLEQLAGVLDEEADLTLLGRLALGRHWRSATPEQREEYDQLFKGMMLRRFAGYLNAYSGNQLDDSAGDLLTIRGSREVAGGDVMVDSRVAPPDRPPINAIWRLRARDGHYMVIDLIIEEISLLITQRAEFSAFIEREGLDGLLTRLREQQGIDS